MKKILVLVAAMAMVFTSCDKGADTPTPDPVPTPPAFKVELEKAIEGDYDPETGDAAYTYEKIDSVIYTAEDQGYFEIRIKADVDWIIDEASIPAVFSSGDFLDKDGNMISAKAGVFSEVIMLKIDDESKMETLPSVVTLKVKDIATSKTVDVVIKLTGVGDTFIVRSDDNDETFNVAKTGAKPVVLEVSYSPAYDFKIVAMKANLNGALSAIEEATWVTVTKTASKAALSKSTITCAIADNSGDPRGATLYAIPTSASITDVFEYNEKYEEYSIKEAYENRAFSINASIIQDGNVSMTFADGGSNTLTKNYGGDAQTGGALNRALEFVVNTTAYFGDNGGSSILLKKGTSAPEWMDKASQQNQTNNNEKAYSFDLLENTTGSSRTATLEFYYYASSSDNDGTKVATLTVTQATK